MPSLMWSQRREELLLALNLQSPKQQNTHMLRSVIYLSPIIIKMVPVRKFYSEAQEEKPMIFKNEGQLLTY